MSADSSFRKKQRAILNSVREACIYESSITIGDSDSTLQATPIELQEKSFRDLDETRCLVIRKTEGVLKLGKKSPLSVSIAHQGEVFSIPILASTEIAPGKLGLTFDIGKIHSTNRRTSTREVVRESFFVPVMIYLGGDDAYPVSGFGRVIDFDSKAICFELKIPILVAEADLLGATVIFQDHTVAPNKRFEIAILRDIQPGLHFGSPITTVTAVSLVSSEKIDTNTSRSMIQPQGNFQTAFKLFLKDSTNLDISIIELAADGFSGKVAPHEMHSLPRYFVSEHSSTRIRFNVSRVGDELIFRHSSTSLGVKTEWYNFVTHKFFKYEYRFQVKDTKEITRLMLETGIYSQRQIADLTLLHGYLQYKWPIEEVLPRTKYRWLVRDNDGAVIGHNAGVRISENLWAAIDNVGSQNYAGSWNRDFISRWIQIFIELLMGHASDPLVQWTFNPNAGVWMRFDELMRQNPELVHSRDRFWIVPLLTSLENAPVKRKAFKAEALGGQESETSQWMQTLGLESSELLKALYSGTNAGSSFYGDFEHDYSFSFKRHSYLIKRKEKPLFLLTFSNYPDWASFNKGHDFHYLFPIQENVTISKDEEQELLCLIKETVFKDGCTPYKLCIVSDTLRLSLGTELTNLLVQPEALHYAIQSLEQP